MTTLVSVRFLSGELAARVEAWPSSTGAALKAEVAPHLRAGMRLRHLVGPGGRTLGDDEPLSAHGADVEELQAVVDSREWKLVQVGGQGEHEDFKVPRQFELSKILHRGVFGVTTCAFEDPRSSSGVSVQHYAGLLDDLADAGGVLKEVRLLRHFSSHKNVLSILDAYASKDGLDLDDLYVVLEQTDTDLARVIRSRQELTEQHSQYFVYQTLRGLKYIHSSNVIHRSLSPSCLRVNKNCELKICDFGLTRRPGGSDSDQLGGPLHVQNRWYAAPEVLLMPSWNAPLIDVWAVGCILCELVCRHVFLMGRDHLDQIKRIVQVVGTPCMEELTWLPTGSAREYLQKMHAYERQAWSSLFSQPQASAEAHEAMDRMLTFSPLRRATAEQCLELPWLRKLHEPDDEPVCDRAFAWDAVAGMQSRQLLQDRLYAECWRFDSSIAVRDAAQLASRGGIQGLLC